MKLKSKLTIRLDHVVLGMIGEIIDLDPMKYDSLSHIIRVGIVKLHREEMQNAKKEEDSRPRPKRK